MAFSLLSREIETYDFTSKQDCQDIITIIFFCVGGGVVSTTWPKLISLGKKITDILLGSVYLSSQSPLNRQSDKRASPPAIYSHELSQAIEVARAV